MSPSLYVHIPFCLKRCIYCDFVSGIYDPEKAKTYIEALKKEISRIPDGKPLSTLFIGGGTPTALSAEVLTDLIKYIFNRFEFAHDFLINPPFPPFTEGGSELTIEANPGTVDMDKLKAVRLGGINRISIGVQSFNDDELSFLGRIHTSKEAEQVVHLARDAGFENIGIDLIYGIPGQTLERWKMTLDKAVTLRPQHISTYELTVEERTELYEYLKNPSLIPPLSKGGDMGVTICRRAKPGGNTLPPEDMIIEMYEHAIDYLTSKGYVHYEISNFALPCYSCSHNINYWDRGEYYGVGLGAHSFIAGSRFHNTDNLDEYLDLISKNKNAVKGSESINSDMALSEAIFLGLRKTEGLTLKTLSDRYERDISRHYKKELEELMDAGLIEFSYSNGLRNSSN
ncbi:MAG: radical SAM family heme chaperone HemW, partial [Nitrospirota bacterium]